MRWSRSIRQPCWRRKARDVRIIPGLKAGDSVAQTADKVVQFFRSAALESAQADARILIAHALNLDRAGLAVQDDRILEPREIDAISARVARRLKHEPVSRIVGHREFWSLKIAIDSSVLDPRPETETVVEAALDWIVTRGLRNENLRVLDVGTGSGALLFALLRELPHASGIGTDISLAALMLARRNARRLELARRVDFVACDFASALRAPFDLIVANPPYIPSGEISSLAPEVRDYDPRLALDGGPDGLIAYRKIAQDAVRLLTPRARLVVELGVGQQDAVNAILTEAGLLIDGRARKDLMGIDRVLCAYAP